MKNETTTGFKWSIEGVLIDKYKDKYSFINQNVYHSEGVLIDKYKDKYVY
ncbi:MAG: hypothetical protein SOY42_10875 [Clostridium sp.]|nr:hypothetical protein [Clostridium sp.]